MADCTPASSDMFIEIVAPKDAENSKVPFDTKVMYDDKGIEYEVGRFVFGTGPYGCGWDVECFIPSENIIYTRQLDSMYLEKPDSLKQLVEDIERAQYACDHNGMHVAACRYSGNNTCCGCDFRPDYSTCSGKMLGDIAARVKRLCGDSE